jgi:hypothetical protein
MTRILVGALALLTLTGGAVLADRTETGTGRSNPKRHRQPATVVRRDGHQFMSRAAMRRKQHGTHLLRAHRTGHRTFVHLRKGKVAGMSVKAPNGKTYRMKAVRGGSRRRAALEDRDVHLVSLVERGNTLHLASQLDRIILFIIQIGEVRICIAFPITSVDPDTATGAEDDEEV